MYSFKGCNCKTNVVLHFRASDVIFRYKQYHNPILKYLLVWVILLSVNEYKHVDEHK